MTLEGRRGGVDGVGFWSAMEKAHTLITTAVKIYRAGPAMDRTDALKLVPHSDQTPDAQPKQKWSTPHAHNRQHSTLLPPVSDSSDRESGKTPYSECSVLRTSKNRVTHDADNPDTMQRPLTLQTDDQSGRMAAKHTGSRTINKVEQTPPKQNLKRVSHRKKELMLCKKKRTVDISSRKADLCGEKNSKDATYDKNVDLNLAASNKQDDFESNVENKETSLHIGDNKYQITPSSLCHPKTEQNLLKSSLEVSENEILQQPSNMEKKARSHKNVPRQLPVVSNTCSFLSKYKDRQYSSQYAGVHKSRVISPMSSKAANSAARMKLQKSAMDNCSRFSCSSCTFVTLSKSKLMSHVQRQHKGNQFGCDLCGKTFCNKTSLIRHHASHSGPQHCCDVCGKMFKVQKAMINHRKTHEEGYTKPVFSCKLCEKTFSSQYLVDCHVRSFHLGQRKNYLCSFCGKKFTTKHSLQEHGNAHTGIKPHICEICGKGFSYDSALRDHKFIHGDVKQFSCEVCNKSFCQRSAVKMHMRIHKDIKQFQCPECGREFTQKQALQRHERVHKGVKPFMCRLCSQSFSDASIIRRHLILVHKIHKDAKTWREDIISTVQPDLEYHVSKMGVREPDPQPDKAGKNERHTEPRHSRAQAGKHSKKKTASGKETNATNITGSRPVQSISETKHDLHEVVGGDFLSTSASDNNDFSLGGKILTQDTNPTDHPSEKNVLRSVEDFPQVPEAHVHTQSQGCDLSLASVTMGQHYSDSPLMALQSASQQGCSALCLAVDELASLQSTSKSLGSAVQTRALQSSLMQSSTSGENGSRPLSGGDPQSSCPVSRDICPTAVIAGSPTGAVTGCGTPVTAQQSWPSLVYYSQLASQFGMALSDYPYVASSTLAGMGLGPSSPGLEQTQCCPRPQTTSAVVDHVSPLLTRPQGQSLTSCDLLQRHGGRDAFGDGLMLSSPGLESSKSDLSLDGGGDGVLDASGGRGNVLPGTDINQRGGVKTSDSNKV
ncbi:uncharacterized protein LOC143283751 isoform X2 [Babylonia areolata]|uniref:uncharacterized protein LOC143283751 isoform X2 n=1 Tax=Babylonia areolata TaxID=304850 RepID=UPI003FD21E2D